MASSLSQFLYLWLFTGMHRPGPLDIQSRSNAPLYPTTVYKSNGELIQCTESSSCQNSIIHCTQQNSDCNVLCYSESSCHSTTIHGPHHGSLHINCRGPRSCFNATFNASYSSKLSVTGCISEESCLDVRPFYISIPFNSITTFNGFQSRDSNDTALVVLSTKHWRITKLFRPRYTISLFLLLSISRLFDTK